MRIRTFASIILTSAILIACFVLPARAFSATETQKLIDEILFYNTDNQSLDEWYSKTVTKNAGTLYDWYVMGLRQYDKELDYGAYSEAVLEIQNPQSSPDATLLRYTLTLFACGTKEIPETFALKSEQKGVMSEIFSLHLQNNIDIQNCKEAVTSLLSKRKSDGGFSVVGESFDVDVTAMALQALAPHCKNNSDVKQAVDHALELLSQAQQSDGDFISFGSANCESTAQVLTALCSLQIDPFSDSRFIKNGKTLLDGIEKYRLTDNSYAHDDSKVSNKTATVQVFYALVSLWRMQNGYSPLYVFENKAELESASSQSESKETVGEHYVNYKLYACLAIAAFTLLVSLCLFLKKKRNYKSYLFVLLISAVAIVFVLISNFSTPNQYYKAAESAEGGIKVDISIECKSAVGKASTDTVPKDGVMLAKTAFTLEEGISVYDLLVTASKQNGIILVSKGFMLGMPYVAGINNLYEFDCGELSGWVYTVNGVSPSVGCGDYVLKNGDYVQWVYTLDLGNLANAESK